MKTLTTATKATRRTRNLAIVEQLERMRSGGGRVKDAVAMRRKWRRRHIYGRGAAEGYLARGAAALIAAHFAPHTRKELAPGFKTK